MENTLLNHKLTIVRSEISPDSNYSSFVKDTLKLLDLLEIAIKIGENDAALYEINNHRESILSLIHNKLAPPMSKEF